MQLIAFHKTNLSFYFSVDHYYENAFYISSRYQHLEEKI